MTRQGLDNAVHAAAPSFAEATGGSDEAGVRQGLQFDPAPGDYKLGGKMPDGVMTAPDGDTDIALEINYLSANERPLHDPGRNVKFIFNQDLEQAKRYTSKYKGGLLWVTNDTKLAEYYKGEFDKAKLSDVRVIVIPSVQE